MSTVTPTGGNPNSPSSTSSVFDNKLDIAKSSKIIADYMRQTGKGAISGSELTQLANNASGSVPAEVSNAAKYLERHPEVFTAIETHDVATVDDFSGVWNLDWAADGGLAGSDVERNANTNEAISRMEEVFDYAIAKSSLITEITTNKKTEIDSTKQRPSN